MKAVRRPKIVILGAGYGGLSAVRRLQKLLMIHEADLFLVSKHDFQHETIWLHEAAAGTLNHNRARYKIKSILDQSKVQFIQGQVTEIKPELQKVLLEEQEMDYDYLIIALGGNPETFGIPGLKENALFISDIDSSRQIKEHIEYQFASYRGKEERDGKKLKILVGGAGFTGIEFLGEITDRISELCQEYDIDRELVKLYCVEALNTVLPGFDPMLSAYARSVLEQRGVEFYLGTAIKECNQDGVKVSNGEEEWFIEAGTVIWAAGVRGNPVIEQSGLPHSRARIPVDDYLRVPGYDSIFAVGDCSLVINPETNRPYPPTAQMAMQQGDYVGKLIAQRVRGKAESKPFVYNHKGTVCSLGSEDGVGVVFGRKITGYKAAFMKKIIDNRALFLKGGLPLLLQRGKFRPF